MQKPATHGCGRVLSATNQFEQNTTTHWTSQARSDFLFHSRCTNRFRGKSGLARMSERPRQRAPDDKLCDIRRGVPQIAPLSFGSMGVPHSAGFEEQPHPAMLKLKANVVA
jgi:hypothetical protein